MVRECRRERLASLDPTANLVERFANVARCDA
jgi:hypothetical protein